MNVTMDAESEKRYASTSSSPSPSSSYSSSCERLDRLVDTEEIEAAETLAQLAMCETHSADKRCAKRGTRRVTPESPILDSDLSHSPLGPGGQAIAGQQLDEKIPTTTSVETERIQQDDCSRHMKVEQDADLLPNASYSLVRCSKARRNLTEEEKEARRIRRILANRESARQTIRRRQALCEELTRKAATLVVENENLKREKELALKEYQSLETTNKHLKAQIAKSINTEVEKTPVEPESSSVAGVTPLSGNSPWFLYNHFTVPQIFWPSILPSSNPVHLQNTSFNSITIPSNANIPCSSESESRHKQNNLINDNRTQNMFPYPWLFPLPQFGNGQSSPSSSLKNKQDNVSLGKQCSSSSSLNTLANVDYQAALPIKLKTEASGWTEARPIDDPGCATPRFSLDGGEKKTGCHIIEKFHGPALGCNGHASAVKLEHELQLLPAPNNKVSSTAYIATSSLEKKQEQFICQGKNLADAVAAAEARKRRRELTKQKSIHNRQSRMHC
ncbi:Transcription factor HBP-1a [Spatholobus suberectus]|nr:Transcription factor HBP-1a [Spatholobus suberectus]